MTKEGRSVSTNTRRFNTSIGIFIGAASGIVGWTVLVLTSMWAVS